MRYLTRPDFKNICKVAAGLDLETESYCFHPMVSEIQVFMDPATHPTPNRQAEATRWNDAVGCGKCAIDQEYAARVVGDIATVEKIPRLSVRVDAPIAE